MHANPDLRVVLEWTIWRSGSVISMRYFPLSLAIALLMIGCNRQDFSQLETAANERAIARTEPVVITDRIYLDDHVGEIVTLVGTQTRTKIPRVMGIPVSGNYGLSDQIVSVAGRLESFEITKDDLNGWDRNPGFDQAFAAATIPNVGIHFRIVDPVSGGQCETAKWSNVTQRQDEIGR